MDNVANGNDTVTINGQQRHVASYLMDFLFESDRLRVPVHTLSGGERNRLLLARLFTMPSNLLVLDEPTNDLDVETLELLEELLASYSGTVLMVSHDREFLDGLVTKVYELAGAVCASTWAASTTSCASATSTASTPWLLGRPPGRARCSPGAAGEACRGGQDGLRRAQGGPEANTQAERAVQESEARIGRWRPA